jgi:hypothetical protein
MHLSCRDLAVGACLIGTLFLAAPSRGDVFVLKSGAQLQGRCVEDAADGRRSVQIETATGVMVRLGSSQIAQRTRESDSLAEYERIAPKTADTVADQWKLALWCRDHKLESQRQEHARRVIELDPNQAEAWRSLGYTEIGGEWKTQRQFFEDRGYVFYRGQWRLPQVVDVLEERSRVQLLEREWFGRLRQWRIQLTAEQSNEISEKMSSIRDPQALKALAENLRREKSPAIRLLYVSSLATIPDKRAIDLLVATALSDPDVEVFHTCADQLVALQRSDLAKTLVESLQDSRNLRVNRAAYILGRLGNRDVIPALISKLVTTHFVTRPTGGQVTTTFAKSPTGSGPATQLANMSGAGISIGQSAETIGYRVPNQEVLKALVRLSGGQSFGFDSQAWTNWWAISSSGAASK